jgi:hypothetical protein
MGLGEEVIQDGPKGPQSSRAAANVAANEETATKIKDAWFASGDVHLLSREKGDTLLLLACSPAAS